MKNVEDNVIEDQINIYIQTTGANRGQIVEDEATFEDWFVNDEFNDKNVSEDSKKYIDDLLKTAMLTSELISEKNESKKIAKVSTQKSRFQNYRR